MYCSLQRQEVAARARWSSRNFLDNICKWRLPRTSRGYVIVIAIVIVFFTFTLRSRLRPVVLLSCCVSMLETSSHTRTQTFPKFVQSCSLFHVMRSFSYISRIQYVSSIHLRYVICCSLSLSPPHCQCEHYRTCEKALSLSFSVVVLSKLVNRLSMLWFSIIINIIIIIIAHN